MGLKELLEIQEMGPGAIEAQEAQGQEDFVTNETLPKECPREQLESLGFVFGEDVDDIFINVQFPDGWSKKPTDHSMWNDLIDPDGRVRGAIFYKAAFYDRSAHMYLKRRYISSRNWSLKDDEVQSIVSDTSAEDPLFSTEKIVAERGFDEYWDAEKSLEKVASDWLNKNFPDHGDVLAYWD